MTACLLLSLVLSAAADTPTVSPGPDGEIPAATFTYKLTEPGLTAGTIFAKDGRLVRSLWSLKALPAGEHKGQWDGKDDVGAAAGAGEYELRVTVNRGAYACVGSIGNSGRAPTPAAHTPTGMHSVAVDAAGAVYTANGWDEAGADFKKWDADGNSLYDGRYQMRNGNPNGAPYSIAVDEAYIYCGMGGWASKPWNHKQQLQRFALKDGKHEKFTNVEDKAEHIQVYEWPEKLVPEGTAEADAKLMRDPLRAVAVSGPLLLVADALGGRIVMYDKVTGGLKGEFSVKLPNALAVGKDGSVWVGHEHKCVSVFDPDGKHQLIVLNDVGEVEAIAIGPDGLLYVADSVAGQVKVVEINGQKSRTIRTLGSKAEPPDRAADKFYQLRGVAVDAKGFVATIQNEPCGGARLARWSPDGKLLWEQFGCEFVSLGNYGVHDPGTLYSMTFHRYALGDHNKGQWEYTGFVLAGSRDYRSDPHGVPRLLRLGGSDFWFQPTGDGLQVYRVEGKVMRLASILGGGDPDPSGKRGQGGQQWTWTDEAGDGKVDAAEVRRFAEPGKARYAVFGVDVDANGNVWYGEHHSRGVWTVPLDSFDKRGNPAYDWAKARQVVPQDKSPLEFQPNMAQRAGDGTIYALGWSKAWPQPKNNPFWMGGTTLARFGPKGERLWAVRLPSVCVGMDTVPPRLGVAGAAGGCMVGTGTKAQIAHFSADGVLVGQAEPGPAMGKQSGWFDNHACVAVSRDRRDGLLDVFAEDDYVLRLGWYRVDDAKLTTLTQKVVIQP
jgi:DNA-binding beta-propeller fold protein YncE